MWIDIIIKERQNVSTSVKLSYTSVAEMKGSRSILIPWLPEEINYNGGDGKFAIYDILDKGEVAVPSGTNLAEYSWESIFPGKNRMDKSMLRGVWQDPKSYHKILTTWREEGTPLQLLIAGMGINVDVLLDRYEGAYVGAFGDFQYSLSFIEDKDIVVTTTNTASAKKRSETQSSTKNYTIKKGDTLWEIAEKYLGSGTKWREIYDLNKTVIEKTAKGRGMKSSDCGWWIFPGCKIKIRT